jgi:hypothetical protein
MPEDDNGLWRVSLSSWRKDKGMLHTRIPSCSIRKSYVDFIRLFQTLNHGGFSYNDTQTSVCGDVASMGWSQALYYYFSL